MTNQDKAVLRQLGQEYMEAASLPVHNEKVKLWKALNHNEMQRPMVVIDQLPWHELNGEGELTCRVEDPFWRKLEYGLRQELYKWNHFPVDMVLDPCIVIPKAVTGNNYGLKIAEDRLAMDAQNDIVSHHYENQIQTEEDIQKIQDMQIVHDEKQSEHWLEEAKDVFDGIAPVRQSGGIEFHLGIWDHLAMLMGVEDIYLDLIDRPEFVHAYLERKTEATIEGIKQANQLGAHNDNSMICHCSYIFTDSLLPQPGSGKGPVSQNSWAFGMAQLFTSVSPATTKEFEIPYISRMAEHFGMMYYGCCDRLDDRLELVKAIPNVRKISCSPWSNRDAFCENIGRDYIVSNKPSPAFIAVESLDLEVVRKDLEHTVRAARSNNANLELILKDISTVRYQPERLTQWAQLAMEIVQQ